MKKSISIYTDKCWDKEHLHHCFTCGREYIHADKACNLKFSKRNCNKCWEAIQEVFCHFPNNISQRR